MARLKVYTIACNFYDNGEFVSIDLVKLLDRYDIKPIKFSWGVKYEFEKMVESHVRSKLRVRYEIVPRVIKVPRGGSLPEFYRLSEESLRNRVDWLNRTTTMTIHRMTEDEFRKIFSNYGNDYTKQIRGE